MSHFVAYRPGEALPRTGEAGVARARALRPHQLDCSGMPSAYPDALCTPTTARSWNSSSVRAPAYVHALRNPATIPSSRSSTPGRTGSRYIRDAETPSSNSAFRARSNGLSPAVRCCTARADAMPKLSLYSRPSVSRYASPGDSYVPANHDPIITFDAPAASASATSRGYRTPPSAQTCRPRERACAAHSKTAENCGRPTPVIIRVVHIAPGPTPTLTMSAPAATRSRTPSADTTLPATTGTGGDSDRTAASASNIRRW